MARVLEERISSMSFSTGRTGADFTGASLPSDDDELVSMFEKAKSLFGAEFDPQIATRLEEAMPAAFEMASKNGSYESAGTTETDAE